MVSRTYLYNKERGERLYRGNCLLKIQPFTFFLFIESNWNLYIIIRIKCPNNRWTLKVNKQTHLTKKIYDLTYHEFKNYIFVIWIIWGITYSYPKIIRHTNSFKRRILFSIKSVIRFNFFFLFFGTEGQKTQFILLPHS